MKKLEERLFEGGANPLTGRFIRVFLPMFHKYSKDALNILFGPRFVNLYPNTDYEPLDTNVRIDNRWNLPVILVSFISFSGVSYDKELICTLECETEEIANEIRMYLTDRYSKSIELKFLNDEDGNVYTYIWNKLNPYL